MNFIESIRFKSVIFFSAFLLMPNSALASVSGSISNIGESTHLEFTGKENWNYKIQRLGPNSLKLRISPFDDKTVSELTGWSDGLVKSVSVNKNSTDGQYEVTFQLTGELVDSFDYLTDQPSRMIIDFFTSDKKVTKSKATTASSDQSGNAKRSNKNKAFAPKVKTRAAKTISTKDYEKLNQRNPASTEFLDMGKFKSLGSGADLDLDIRQGIFDGGDPKYDRFRIKDYEIKDEAIIASKQNIYIEFPILKLKTSRLDEILSNPPEYVINPKDTRENKEARLLQTLYEKKRWAAFLKTYDYYIKKYPDSIYDEIVRNLKADVHFNLYKRDGSNAELQKSNSTLKYLINKYPDSVMTERLELILAYRSLEHGEGTGTIQKFLSYLDKYGDSKERDQAYKALSEGYLFINKYRDATKTLKSLEKKAVDAVSGIEATYRLGDVEFQNKNYKKAVSLYKQAIKKYPGYEGKFANANFNMAEAEFWLGRYKSSLNHYVRFLELFPSHSHGSFALTRVGEVLGILGADEKRVIGAFMESSYRFKETEGSKVAKVRILSRKMKSMKEKELGQALEEIEIIGKNSKLPQMEEFATLLISDGLHRRKEYQKAMDFLISYYQRNPTSTDARFFRKRILKNISALMLNALEEGRFLDVLNINSEYATTWLKTKEREDVKYYVARAYETSGVFDEAIGRYKKSLEKLESIKGTREEKERRVNENLPSISQVHLRLAATHAQKRDFKSSLDHLAKIREVKSLMPVQKVEMVELTALVAEQRGRLKLAKRNLKELTEAWQDEPELLASTYLKLAELDYKTANYADAEDSLSEIERMKVADSEIDSDLWFKTLKLKGEVLEKLGQKVAAVEAYTKLMDEFSSTKSLAPIRFKTGKILFETGNIKGAEKIWNGLNPEKDSMYVKLANEKLSGAQWEDNYKKYIDRIPAATSIKGSKNE